MIASPSVVLPEPQFADDAERLAGAQLEESPSTALT